MAQDQVMDPDANRLLQEMTPSLPAIPFKSSLNMIVCDELQGRRKPMRPAAHRYHKCFSLHNLTHLSIFASARLVTERSLWFNDNRSVRQ